jgi:AcrR family transcriptional regulator
MNQLVHISTEQTAKASKPVKPLRTNDPERTMAGILDVATQEFAEKGLDGARIDQIAAAKKACI